MKRHEELRPLSRGHQPLLVHVRDLRWRATYVERGDDHLGTGAWPTFRAWARLALEAHLIAEETHLLPRLRGSAIAQSVLDEDAAARAELRERVQSSDDTGSVDTLRAIADALERHARHCEHVLFPAAEEALGDDGLRGLADAIGAYEI